MGKITINGVTRDMTSDEQAEHDNRITEREASKTQRQLDEIKEIRLEKLQETDFWVLRGDITDAQKLYRKNLRDIPTNYNSSKYDELLARDSDGQLTHSIWENA